jgi:hypothetical protein
LWRAGNQLARVSGGSSLEESAERGGSMSRGEGHVGIRQSAFGNPTLTSEGATLGWGTRNLAKDIVACAGRPGWTGEGARRSTGKLGTEG